MHRNSVHYSNFIAWVNRKKPLDIQPRPSLDSSLKAGIELNETTGYAPTNGSFSIMPVQEKTWLSYTVQARFVFRIRPICAKIKVEEITTFTGM
jgi:hypothetical protein